ncbi:hypothetical protein ATANTOWER_029427 [Ataeniobius toweri]|uniref:Uncharacterized protein n=1 Tax=Ataeniobius toweri TaxID=208326 RepID=A0ABU7B3C5_9TELE|nr:hypothetical protein [Ataeniobius toweri]
MDILNRNTMLPDSLVISMHSALGWASDCMNCINAAWHGDQPVVLLRCDGNPLMEDFRSSSLLVLVSLIFLLTIFHRFSMGLRSGQFCWPVNTMVIEPAFGTFGNVGRYQFLLGSETSISIKLESRRKHEGL